MIPPLHSSTNKRARQFDRSWQGALMKRAEGYRTSLGLGEALLHPPELSAQLRRLLGLVLQLTPHLRLVCRLGGLQRCQLRLHSLELRRQPCRLPTPLNNRRCRTPTRRRAPPASARLASASRGGAVRGWGCSSGGWRPPGGALPRTIRRECTAPLRRCLRPPQPPCLLGALQQRQPSVAVVGGRRLGLEPRVEAVRVPAVLLHPGA